MRAQQRRNLRFEQLDSRLLFAADLGGALQAEGESQPLPDFSLLDVNATSTTANQQVSPRDFVGRVSGYYFGNAM